MAGKGGKGLVAGKTMAAAAAAANKDKDKKRPVSRSARAGLQVCISPAVVKKIRNSSLFLTRFVVVMLSCVIGTSS